MPDVMTSRDVITYSVGICAASACAPKEVAREQIEEAVNSAHPTGINSPWRIAEEETFATGEEIPHQCEQNPDRLHWLLHC